MSTYPLRSLASIHRSAVGGAAVVISAGWGRLA